MKRLVTALIISSSLLISAQAIRADDNAMSKPPHSAEQILNRMSDRLNLTEEQQQNIKPVLEAEFEKMRAIREESRQKIESYLTEEQKKQLADRDHRKGDFDKKHCKKGDDR